MEGLNQTTDSSPTSPPPTSPRSQLVNDSAPAYQISTAHLVYLPLAVLSLAAACFLLYSFVQTFRAQRRVAWLDCLFWALCSSQLLLVLLSLPSVAYGPGGPTAPPLACAALSFSVHAASLCGLLLLVLMAYVLTFDPPSHSLLRRPAVSAALLALASVLSAVVLAAVRWARVGVETRCVVDPLADGMAYAVARLCLSFLIPCSLLLAVLITGCVQQRRSRGRFLSGSEEGPVFLALAAVLFLCQLLYDAALLTASGPRESSAHSSDALGAAEAVLFTGSAVSLLLVLFMHRTCRDSLKGALRQLRDCCRGLGGAQTHRHITAPRIEISDTLPDFNTCSLKDTIKEP